MPSAAETVSRHSRQADAALRPLSSSSVRILNDALVWGAFPAEDGSGWEIALHGADVPARLIARTLILATGAYDRPIPFPGWTLPGVMTAGGVQSFLKTQRLPPGRRFLLAGTGPLQIAVAAGLVQAESGGGRHPGGDEAALARSCAMQQPCGDNGTVWRKAGTTGGRYSRLACPLRMGWAVVEARGNGQVEEAVICRVDDTGQPVPGSSETVAVDTIAIGYGLIPSTELSRLLGCVHEFRPEQGGTVPRRDAEMQTSLPGVYAAGDGAGIGGAELAQIEGRIAAFAAARRLGKLSETAARHAIDREQPGLARQQRFARMLGDVVHAGPWPVWPGQGRYGGVSLRGGHAGRDPAGGGRRCNLGKRGQRPDSNRHGELPGSNLRRACGEDHRSRDDQPCRRRGRHRGGRRLHGSLAHPSAAAGRAG